MKGGVAVESGIRNMFKDITGKLAFLFQNVRWFDLLDILIVAFLIYEVIILVRHTTRAAQLAKGVVLLLVVYIVALMADMRALTYILNAVMGFGIVVLAVVFQPELRRVIEQVGGGTVNLALSHIFRPSAMEDEMRTVWQRSIAAVCDAVERMAEDRTGALIVLERRTNLAEIIRTGTPLHSDVNVETLTTIFYEGTPLHDGAVVVRDGKIEAAGCFLPLSNNMEISKDMGTRHRSALGMSENSDAVVVVVSEETGVISLAKSGVLIRRMDRQNLFNLLVSEVVPPKQSEKKSLFSSIFKRKGADGGDEEE